MERDKDSPFLLPKNIDHEELGIPSEPEEQLHEQNRVTLIESFDRGTVLKVLSRLVPHGC